MLLAVHMAGSALVHRAEHSALLLWFCGSIAALPTAQHTNPAFLTSSSNETTSPQLPELMA